MPLLYPIASTARSALDAEGGARTIAEARELAKGPVELVSDWLRPQPNEREEIQGKAEAGVARGFVQLYEDKQGRPVIAVSFWKPVTGVKTKPRKAKPEKPKAAEDYTDDLYFEKKKGASKRKKKSADPNQLDLFGPDQQGAEHSDPHNPSVVIVDEEGSGAAFGGVDESTPEKG
ncbi:MAG: hypothetical protein QM773_03410 [Hyphomonadaceae bacterium]